jgi:PAS domain S-box-containing protein
LTVFFADITARKAAESALRQSRDVLTLAMRGGSMGAWSRDLATDEVWWSRELEELFGLQPGAFNRTEAGFFEFVHEDDREAVQRAVSHAIQHGSDYIIEFRFRHADGEWRWMEGRGRAVYDDDGTPRHLYGIGIDITERKCAELALREAKSSAEAANQLKDQFLATLSHELRTPLNAILGYAQMLQTNTIAPDKRQRALEVIERNAVAQTQLVNDLLDMSRITTGKVRLDPAPVPVVTVLREALDGVKPAVEAKGITLEIDVDPLAGSVRADSTRLQQVFWNLLTNAVKFTAEGGRIAVSLRRSKARIEIDVKDNGRGISPDFLPFVFDPFRQAESGFDRAHGGLGLGLAITRQLVELHGGAIVAASPGLGQGTTFTVVLPSVDLDGPSLAS